MKIIYPKPPRKAAFIQRAELRHNLQVGFLFLAGFAVFLMLMQSLPYLMRLAGVL